MVERDFLGRSGKDLVFVDLPLGEAFGGEHQAARRRVCDASDSLGQIGFFECVEEVALKMFARRLNHPVRNFFGTNLQQELSH